MTALTTNSPSVRKMDCAAFQISDVEWDAKKGRFRFKHKNWFLALLCGWRG